MKVYRNPKNSYKAIKIKSGSHNSKGSLKKRSTRMNSEEGYVTFLKELFLQGAVLDLIINKKQRA